MSLDRLIEGIAAKQNPTVAGLDPKLEYIPAHLREAAAAKHGDTLEAAAEAIFAFNRGLIDALAPIVPAVKPQCAYYEMYGWQGVKALHDTIAYAQSKGLFVITDGKRNDIGSTMEAYAAAHLGNVRVGGGTCVPFGGDALTVNGYLGSDGITPLIPVCGARDKGMFVLVKTSNPSSGELQNLTLEGGQTIYEKMGGLCERWGLALPGRHAYSGVGAVVGATYPEELRRLRALLPSTFFLVPGYGAQGGGAEGVAGGFDANGLGAVVNASRSIMCAWQRENDPLHYDEAAAREALSMKADLLGVIGEIRL